MEADEENHQKENEESNNSERKSTFIKQTTPKSHNTNSYEDVIYKENPLNETELYENVMRLNEQQRQIVTHIYGKIKLNANPVRLYLAGAAGAAGVVHQLILNHWKCYDVLHLERSEISDV